MATATAAGRHVSSVGACTSHRLEAVGCTAQTGNLHTGSLRTASQRSRQQGGAREPDRKHNYNQREVVAGRLNT